VPQVDEFGVVLATGRARWARRTRSDHVSQGPCQATIRPVVFAWIVRLMWGARW